MFLPILGAIILEGHLFLRKLVLPELLTVQENQHLECLVRSQLEHSYISVKPMLLEWFGFQTGKKSLKIDSP